jgi:hypothetical protein
LAARSCACSARTVPSSVNPGVFLSPRMPTPTGGETKFSACRVVPSRDWLQVSRIHALAVQAVASTGTGRVQRVTQMVECHPVWDRAYQVLVDPSRRSDRAIQFSHPELSVSIGIERCRPQPACLGLVHIAPEPLLRRVRIVGGPSPLPPVIVPTTPAAPDDGLLTSLNLTGRSHRDSLTEVGGIGAA